MIKEILSVFKSNSYMDRAYQRSFEMLDITQEMFLKAKEVLRNTDTNQLDIDINDEDHKVNKYQREVRKDVFNHLVMSGVAELSSGLVLVSIVIDLERIGDLTKNIVEIAQAHPLKLIGGKFEDELARIESAVEENFALTIKCFKESDEELGRKIVTEYKWVSKSCDSILVSLMKKEDPSLDSGTAVSMALYLRALKRINSHLRNVASSVVNPFHRIGYKPKKNKFK